MNDHPAATEQARSKQAAFHRDTVDEVTTAIRANEVVVVGMALNPHVKRARRALDAAGVPHAYVEIGGYHNRWKERLAVKLWSGWPTFPQVFANGVLVGGADETQAMLDSGELAAMLASSSS